VKLRKENENHILSYKIFFQNGFHYLSFRIAIHCGQLPLKHFALTLSDPGYFEVFQPEGAQSARQCINNQKAIEN
jgi:hypothetical protein